DLPPPDDLIENGDTDGPDDTDTDTGDSDGDDGDTSEDDAGGSTENGGSGGGNVTASYGPARGTASIDDFDDACEWIDVSEVEDIIGESGLDFDGFGVPGMDVQCEYENDAGSVWVQMVYAKAEPDLDLTEELSADIPTI